MRLPKLLNPILYWRRASEIAGRQTQRYVDWRDSKAFRREWPMVAKNLPRLPQIRKDLQPVYANYLRTTSSAGMPVSLELAALLWLMVETLRPKRVLDLGSGFSSYVLRMAVASVGNSALVISVDDAENWLDKTREFLRSHGLPDAGVISWNTFAERKHEEFDLILDDLGRTPFRIYTLDTALKYLAPGGVFLLDDFHKVVLRVFAQHTVGATGHRCISLRRFTLDGFGRYAALVALQGARR
jgi:predicted O-methyltransferase YrrM